MKAQPKAEIEAKMEEERLRKMRDSRGESGADELADANLGSEVHTWPDGSQAVGRPPWPAKSPKERAAEGPAEAAAVGMFIPPGKPQSGEATPPVPGGVTPEQFKEKVEQQLESDVMSGKDPHTPNPTTSSDKPELAGATGVVTADMLEPTPVLTSAEIDALAAGIKPEGNIKATEEQKKAAVVQVARETKGPIGGGAAFDPKAAEPTAAFDAAAEEARLRKSREERQAADAKAARAMPKVSDK